MAEYTMKQIAEWLGVSKPTAQKIAKKLDIKPCYIDDITQCRFYTLEDTEKIISQRQPNFDFSALRPLQNDTANTENKPQSFAETPQNDSANFAESAANTAKEPQNFAETPQKDNSNSELELLRHTLEIIEKQLEEKDKQLSIKDKQIEDLSNRLAEAMQLTKGQQYIAAADKTTELLEVDTKEKKKSFWKRLFKR